MRKLFIIPFLLFVLSAEAAPPSRQFTYASGATITASQNTANEDAIYNYLQSGIDEIADGTIVNADVHSSANIQSDKLNLTAIAQSVANSGSTTLTGTFAANGTTNSIGNGGSDTLTLNVPGGMTLSAATTWTLTGALTFSGTIADLGTVTTANIDGGTLDGVQVGGTTATGELLVNDASDDADGLGSQGTSGQYLQSAGAGANPTWVTPLGILSSTTSLSTVSLSGNINLTSGKRYILYILLNQVSVDMTVYLQFDDDTGATAYRWNIEEVTYSTTPSESLSGDDSDSFLSLGTVDGVSDRFSCFLTLDTNGASAASPLIFVFGNCGGNNSAGANVTRQISGSYLTDGTINSVELYASTGNFSGTVIVHEMN